MLISNSALIHQRIVGVVKHERSDLDRNSNLIQTPSIVNQYEKQVLKIDGTEVVIDDIDQKCYQLTSLSSTLSIRCMEDNAILSFANSSGLTIYNEELSLSEKELQEELLRNDALLNYDFTRHAILVPFNEANLSLIRDIKIEEPSFNGEKFKSVELHNVRFIPSDPINADLWYNELLFKNMTEYFVDELSFTNYAHEIADPFQTIYSDIFIPNRKQFIKNLKKKENAFYQLAKLETIDYLNYEK